MLNNKEDKFYPIAYKEFKKIREDDFFFFNENTRNYLFLDSLNNVIGEVDVIITSEAEILFIYVKEELRQKGYGFSILNELFNILKSEDIKEIFIDVDNKNIPAISLYNKCGFKTLYTRKEYYKNGHDALVMHKVLEV